MSLFAELQRRSVFKVGAAYLVVGWLLIQVAATVFPSFGIPEWGLRMVTLVVLLGFPVALLLAWAFEVTPEGIKADPHDAGNRRMFVAAAVMAALAVGWFLRSGSPSPDEGGDPRSIAVLPFVNMSGDPANEYFSDGISEEILNSLAQVPELKVAARTSSFSFKGKPEEVPEIARALEVHMVLEGSVRKQGDRVRITAQLIDAHSGYHLWSQNYDRELKDIFAIQDEIAREIVKALKVKFGVEVATIEQAQAVDPAAYDDYLQGRAFIAQRVGDSPMRAIEAFDRALARAPDYAAAHSGRAFAQLLVPLWDGQVAVAPALAAARASAERALALDPENAEAYMVRGVADSMDLRIAQSRADLDRALALAPGNVDILNFDGDLLMIVGDLRGAERRKRKAMELDPLAFVHPMNLSDVMSAQGRYAESRSFAERAVALGGGAWAMDRLVFAQFRLGNVQAARQVADDVCRIATRSERFCVLNRVVASFAEGDRRGAEAMLEGLIAPLRAAGTLASITAVQVSVFDDPVAAARLVRETIDLRDPFLMGPLLYAAGGAKLPEEISQDPRWLEVWKDPRIAELMAAYRANVAAFRAGG